VLARNEAQKLYTRSSTTNNFRNQNKKAKHGKAPLTQVPNRHSTINSRHQLTMTPASTKHDYPRPQRKKHGQATSKSRAGRSVTKRLPPIMIRKPDSELCKSPAETIFDMGDELKREFAMPGSFDATVLDVDCRTTRQLHIYFARHQSRSRGIHRVPPQAGKLKSGLQSAAR
jgi:hypothetical protein